MLFRLSLKNLKKSIRDYSIYFFTLILGVCIFYLFNSSGAQTAMIELSKTKAASIDMLNTAHWIPEAPGCSLRAWSCSTGRRTRRS